MNVSPVQSLTGKVLEQINAPTAGDAARYFSGVQVKDYGGAGGLKTVSVRSLGASQTMILYDGLPVSDVQSGQTDLSRFSTVGLYNIELYNAHAPLILQPARFFAASSVLAMYTPGFYPTMAVKNRWEAGVRQGSYGYWQGLGSFTQPLSGRSAIHISLEGVTSKGNYPFVVENGNRSEKTRRNNSAIRSLQGEVNFIKTFKDSSVLQVKGWGFQSKRGLPGTVFFFNDRSVQTLDNRDYFGQARYQRVLFRQTSLLLSGKFTHSYTRYLDPDFLNTGGRDDQYRQQEAYMSVAVAQPIMSRLSVGGALDVSHTTLHANNLRLREPFRFSSWGNGSLNYSDSLWKMQASLLLNRFSDGADGTAGLKRNSRLTPTVSVSRKLSPELPLLLRFFYKQVYRMPTFNDLYYNFIGNIDLHPELARQYNLGLSYSVSGGRYAQRIGASIDGYINRISDKIIAVPSQNLFSWSMLNLGTVDIRGLDMVVEADGAAGKLFWSGRLSYTWQQARDVTDPASRNYKDRIPYSPDHSGSGIVAAGFKQWGIGYNLTFSGTRYTLGDNIPYNRLPGWKVHDLFLSRTFDIAAIRCVIKAEINNVGDQRYDIIRYYPMPGRTYKLSFTIKQL